MCQENYYFHSCQHLTYHGIHPCDRFQVVQQLCVTLTTTPRITSLATPIYRQCLKGYFLRAVDTTSSSTTTCSNPYHLPINPRPGSRYPDLPDDLEIPPPPYSKTEYSKPRMTKRTVAVNFDCKECRSERMRPGCKGLTIEEQMVVEPEIELTMRYQLWKSWHSGFQEWWNDPNTVREREERERAARFVENPLWDENGESALQVRFEGKNAGADGGAEAEKDKGKAVMRHNGDTAEGQAYVSIFGGDK